ncbi:MAG: plastocyanin/azurin family copper-binding protein [Longimicrobiales bacterium]
MVMAGLKYAGRQMRHAAVMLCTVAAVPALLFTSGAAAHAQTTSHASHASPAVQVDTTITIRTTGSNLEFSPSRISAKAGTRVRISYTNEGTLPHNIVLVKEEGDIDMLGMAAFQASKTDYVPVQHSERMIAHTELAVPGTTVEMTFVVPPAGEYFFVCLYPGHYNMMVGTLRSLK